MVAVLALVPGPHLESYVMIYVNCAVVWCREGPGEFLATPISHSIGSVLGIGIIAFNSDPIAMTC